MRKVKSSVCLIAIIISLIFPAGAIAFTPWTPFAPWEYAEEDPKPDIPEWVLNSTKMDVAKELSKMFGGYNQLIKSDNQNPYLFEVWGNGWVAGLELKQLWSPAPYLPPTLVVGGSVWANGTFYFVRSSWEDGKLAIHCYPW